jgi:uncharacterized membrane-anchored protein
MTPSPPSSKLPALVATFWVMKIAATTLGETAGDLLSMTLKIGYAASSLSLLAGFVVCVGLQLASRRYRPTIYWLTILATSTAGTTMSDYMDRTLGLGYAKGAALLVAALLAVLLTWRLSTGSLSVAHVTDRRSEAFYWCAILVSNTLGTALGDFLADDSGLGFAGGALLIGGLLAGVLVLTYATRLSRVALFWIAFVLTRPFGATVGDVLTKGPEKGGLGFGTIGASAVLTGVLVVFVARAAAIEHRRLAGAPVKS